MENEIFKEILTEIKSMKSDITSMKSDITSMKSDIGGLKSSQEQMQSDIGGLKSSQEQMQSSIISINTKIDNNHKESMAKLDSLENKFDDLEPKNASRHIEIINRMDGLSKDLTVVEVVSGKNMTDIAYLKAIK